MLLIRKSYPIELTQDQMGRLHQGLLKNAYAKLSLSQGIKLYTLEEYRRTFIRGLCVLGNSDKTQVIGSAFRDDNMNRVWFIQQTPTTGVLYIDGYPSVVSGLGLTYDATTNQIGSTYLQSVLLTSL